MPYLAPVGGGGPRRGGGHRVALAFDRRPSKAPAMRAKHNPGSGRLTCVFKVCLDGKGENKKPAPARRGKSKRPYWHTGGSLWSSFRSGRQQQDAICSAAPKGSGWIRRGRGHASWNNRLQSKSQRMPGTGCVDLKPTWPIYKFCFHWWQAELPDRGRFGELPGATICSVPPLPSGNERD